MRHMSFIALLCAFGALSGASQATDAPLRWDKETDRNSFTLTLRHQDPRAPLPFLAACEERGDLKLTIGAPLDQVEKAGTPVSVKLDAGGKSATISGKARVNEFTKVMELAVETNADDPLFAVLATGKPVKITRPAKEAMTWPAADAEVVQQWVSDCKSRSEH